MYSTTTSTNVFINDFGVPEMTPAQRKLLETKEFNPNEFNPTSVPYHTQYRGPKCCEHCSNNPKNNPNASGFCDCSLPSMEQFRC